MTDRSDLPIRTPVEWCAELGVTVLDPDGWRTSVGQYAPRPWADPISREEFAARSNVSTVRPAATAEVVGRFAASAEWLADQEPWAALEAEARAALREMFARREAEEARP